MLAPPPPHPFLTAYKLTDWIKAQRSQRVTCSYMHKICILSHKRYLPNKMSNTSVAEADHPGVYILPNFPLTGPLRSGENKEIGGKIGSVNKI